MIQLFTKFTDPNRTNANENYSTTNGPVYYVMRPPGPVGPFGRYHVHSLFAQVADSAGGPAKYGDLSPLTVGAQFMQATINSDGELENFRVLCPVVKQASDWHGAGADVDIMKGTSDAWISLQAKLHFGYPIEVYGKEVIVAKLHDNFTGLDGHYFGAEVRPLL